VRIDQALCLVPRISAEQLERNVDVVWSNSKKYVNKAPQYLRYHVPYRSGLARRPITKNSVVPLKNFPCATKIVELDFTVSVQQQQGITRCRAKSRKQSRAVPGIRLMYNAHQRIAGCYVIKNVTSSVGTSVVNENDFKSGYLRQHLCEDVIDHFPNGAFLIKCGDDNA
jgi:hypothetical protein